MVARDVFDGESGGHYIDLDVWKVRERKGEHDPLCEDVVEREGQKCLGTSGVHASGHRKC